MLLSIPKFEKRMEELSRRRYLDMEPIPFFRTMEPEPSPDAPHVYPPALIQDSTLSLGDMFIGRDRYLWVWANACLPPPREDSRIVGRFDFGQTGSGGNSGFEAMLYLNGQPWQGVDSNHQEVFLDHITDSEATIVFLLWTGLEGGGKHKISYHQVREAHIGYLHRDADEYYYLFKSITETLKLFSEDEPNYHALTKLLEASLLEINWDEDKFYSTVTAALQTLTSGLKKMEKQTPVVVNCIGQTHIDVAWLWRLKHTREKAVRSFSTVLRLMEQFDDYLFLQTQPQLYQYVKQDCPELYSQIRQRVEEGRWETDGGMWLEADCNIPSGESLVRQFLYGISFFQKEFGVRCQYLWLPDVFGYSWALPQIMKLCGISTFMTTKISWNQFNSIPNDLFLWRGIDGSEILTYFVDVPDERQDMTARFSTYNGTITSRAVQGSWKKFKNKDITQSLLLSFGYGDGGGGPNRDMLMMRRALDKIPGIPHVKPRMAGDFFEEIHLDAEKAGDNLPVWDGELYLEFHRGTYTSQARNKKKNRQLEWKAGKAEWLTALASLVGGDTSESCKNLHQGWEIILRNQFHDIIPGSSIHEVYEDSQKEYAQAEGLLDQASNLAQGAFIHPDSEADGCLYTISNPSPFFSRGIAEIPLKEDGIFTLEDHSPVAAQKSENGWLVSVPIPSRSMVSVQFHPKASVETPSPFTFLPEEGYLETPFYKIRWDDQGHLVSVYDKDFSREVLAGEGNVLEIFEDKPLNYDAWDVDIFYPQKRETATVETVAKLLECGPLRTKLLFTYKYNLSTFYQEWVFYSQCRRIDFFTRALWQEDHRFLKAAFPVNIRTVKASFDIQYGHVERPTHFNTSWDYAKFEVCAHKWADLSETDYGVSLLNDCKYGYNAKNNVLKISLLKSAKHPDTSADMGEHTFTYSLLPHGGSVTAEGAQNTIEQAFALNLPFDITIGGCSVAGQQVFKTDSGRITIDAVKCPEAGEGVILRFHECRGTRGPVTISSDFPIRYWRECNLLEEPLGEWIHQQEIACQMKPFQLRTFQVVF